jgi:hypothetical protein
MPKEFTFTDQEILHIFNDSPSFKTVRLVEVPNTWCVWGNSEKEDDEDFNKLGSDILQRDIYSPIMFVHDTEINPSWMLTDDPILKDYKKFKEDLIHFFDKVAENIMRENEENVNRTEQNLVFLNTIGPTEDKRVLFEFDPHRQSNEFYKNNFFTNFSNKVHTFLKKSYKDSKDFIIFEDKRSIIIVADENVNFIIDKIIKDFEEKENYEKCSELKTVMEKWKKYKKKKNPRTPRAKS